jgi:hypothetical protein
MLLMAVGVFLNGVSVGLFTFLPVTRYRFPLTLRLPGTPHILWSGPNFLCNMTGFLLFCFLIESIQRFTLPMRDARTLASVNVVVSLIVVAVMIAMIVRVLPPSQEIPATREGSFILQWLWTRIATISLCSLALFVYGEVTQYFRLTVLSPVHFLFPVVTMATIMMYIMSADARLEKARQKEIA